MQLEQCMHTKKVIECFIYHDDYRSGILEASIRASRKTRKAFTEDTEENKKTRLT